MLASITSTILAAGMLGFVLVASGVLLWEGLAAGAVAARGAAAPGLRRARARLAVGALGVAVALWIALGLLSRAW